MRYSFESTSSIDNTTSTSLYHRIVISTFFYVFHFNSPGIFICELKIFPRDFKIIFMGLLFSFQLERWLFDWTTFETKFGDFHTLNTKKNLWHRILKASIEILAGIQWILFTTGFSEIHCSQMKIPCELNITVNPKIRLIEDRNELKIILCVEWLYPWIKLIQNITLPKLNKTF